MLLKVIVSKYVLFRNRFELQIDKFYTNMQVIMFT